jgi:hypothetical protein
MSPRGCSLRVRPDGASGQEGQCVLVLKLSWHNDVMLVASPPLSAVVALDKDLARPVAAEEGSERNVVWSARRSARCVKGPCLLGCMRLRVIADSPLRDDGRFVRQLGLGSGSRLGPTWHGAG